MVDIAVPQAAIAVSSKHAFTRYLRDNPSDRRISSLELTEVINWLAAEGTRPASQQEFSRRNYVRRRFQWDANKQELLAVPRTTEEIPRKVITEDNIADTVELVHETNGHAGWDATWDNVSKNYYGILRSDVIFLLRECQICKDNPRKRPKNAVAVLERDVEHLFGLEKPNVQGA